MKHKKIYRGISLFFVFIMLFLAIPFTVFAGDASLIEKINSSDVYEDLELMRVDLSNLKKDVTATHVALIDFLEFGYDFGGRTSDYGLYVYLYNPSGRAIDIDSGKNMIQLQTSTVSGIESGYRKYNLIFCDVSDKEEFEYVFYKFKVDVPQSYMYKPTKVNRIYEIADIELMYESDIDSESYGAGGRWCYTGYQAYHGVDPMSSVSSLHYDAEELFTLELELYPATWKTETSDKGEGYQYELFSVYFSVPNSVIKRYGDINDATKGLRVVEGVYQEHEMNGIVTMNSVLRDSIKQYLGKNVNENDVPFGFVTEQRVGYDALDVVSDYTFNTDSFLQFLGPRAIIEDLNSLDTVFYSSDNELDTVELHDAVKALRKENNFHARSLTNGFTSYKVTTEDEDLQIALGNYIAKLSSYTSWDKFWDKIFHGSSLEDDVELLASLQEPLIYVPNNIKDELIYNSKTNAEALYISEGDYKALESFVDKATFSLESTFLMRFAVRDYYASDIKIAQSGVSNDIDYGNNNYFFDKRIFLDFDVLSLTWYNETNGYKIIPVSATPIDIMGSISKPKDSFDPPDIGGCQDALGSLSWLSLLLGAIVLWVLLKYTGIGKLFGKIFGAIGRFVASLFGIGVDYAVDESHRKRADKREREREDRAYKREIEREGRAERRDQRYEGRAEEREIRREGRAEGYRMAAESRADKRERARDDRAYSREIKREGRAEEREIRREGRAEGYRMAAESRAEERDRKREERTYKRKLDDERRASIRDTKKTENAYRHDKNMENLRHEHNLERDRKRTENWRNQ